MNTNAGLKLLVVVLAVLCAALAVRVFANRPGPGKYQLMINSRAPLSGQPSAATVAQWMVTASYCAMDYTPDATRKPQSVCKNGATARDGRPGSPHIQQVVAFENPADLQKVANALTVPASTSGGGGGPTTPASPPPHIQQTAGLNTPQNDRAVNIALQRR
jgi:hypothetical protein